jgi:hypothetical protein
MWWQQLQQQELNMYGVTAVTKQITDQILEPFRERIFTCVPTPIIMILVFLIDVAVVACQCSGSACDVCSAQDNCVWCHNNGIVGLGASTSCLASDQCASELTGGVVSCCDSSRTVAPQNCMMQSGEALFRFEPAAHSARSS